MISQQEIILKNVRDLATRCLTLTTANAYLFGCNSNTEVLNCIPSEIRILNEDLSTTSPCEARVASSPVEVVAVSLCCAHQQWFQIIKWWAVLVAVASCTHAFTNASTTANRRRARARARSALIINMIVNFCRQRRVHKTISLRHAGHRKAPHRDRVCVALLYLFTIYWEARNFNITHCTHTISSVQ